MPLLEKAIAIGLQAAGVNKITLNQYELGNNNNNKNDDVDDNNNNNNNSIFKSLPQVLSGKIG